MGVCGMLFWANRFPSRASFWALVVISIAIFAIVLISLIAAGLTEIRFKIPKDAGADQQLAALRRRVERRRRDLGESGVLQRIDLVLGVYPGGGDDDLDDDGVLLGAMGVES